MAKSRSLKPFAIAALAAIAVPVSAAENAEVPAAGEALAPKSVEWSFEGPFGTYDRGALQRGFQVYKEVCSACHSLSFVAIRTLGQPGGPGFSEAELRALAASYQVPAGPNEQGSTVDANGRTLMRAAAPSDVFPAPFANEQAARAASNGALPPDLSLIVKARVGGPNYVYSILTGYGGEPPASIKMIPGMSYNPYFPTAQIAMPQPLTMGSVTYSDGTPNSVEQVAHDVVTFLAWASEPKLEERKRLGFNVMAFLLLFAGLLYFSYRRVWHGKH